MKSYFAKLAARATLATPVTSSPTGPKLTDPFENTLVDHPVAPAATGTPPVSSPDQVRALQPAPEQSPFQIETVSPRTPAKDSLLNSSPEARARNQSEGIEGSEPASEIQLEPRASSLEERSPVVLESKVTEDPLQLAPPLEKTSSVQAEPRAVNNERDSDLEESAENERLAEIQREQTMLLRKADLFMERLFERRTEKVVHDEPDRDESEREISQENNKVAEPSRLLPVNPSPRAPEPVDEGPNLYIGKLTVEVVQPAPPPVATPQQIVVVRGPRTGRSVVPSSSRFGLGQF